MNEILVESGPVTPGRGHPPLTLGKDLKDQRSSTRGPLTTVPVLVWTSKVGFICRGTWEVRAATS